ncbi:MAG: B12-binding domain-containing protein [Promethearchaeota archaeon]
MTVKVELTRLEGAIIEGEDDEAGDLARAAINAGASAIDILDSMKTALTAAGAKLAKREYFIADLIMCAEAAKQAMNVVLPDLEKTDAKYLGTVVIGVVRGDVHDIGKNLVAAFLRGAGFKVIDLGSDVYPEKFVDAVRQHKPDIIGASAYSTSTADIEFPQIGKALEDAGVRGQVKYVLGGAGAYRDMIIQYEADGFGRDASDAVLECKRLLGLI